LFGGWKAAYYTGYNLPSQNCLFNDYSDSGLYVLNISFAISFGDAVIDTLVVRIIFPEGTKDIQEYLPFFIDGKSTTTHYTYLDTSGRPVLILEKKNVVVEHNRLFQVTYRFSQLSLLQEPLLLIIAYFSFFTFVMLFTRLQFSIGPVKERSPNADKIEDCLLKVKDIMEHRSELHTSLDSALSKYAKTKKKDQYDIDKKSAELSLSAIKRDSSKLISEMEDLDAELGKKIRQLETKEDKKSYNQTQLHDNEIAYSIKKVIPRSAYEESKAEFEKFYTTVDEEIESLLTDLTGSL